MAIERSKIVIIGAGHVGSAILNSLLGMIQGVKEDVDLTYKPELIIRDSCASPAPASRWRRE